MRSQVDADVRMEMNVSSCLSEQSRCEFEHLPIDSFRGNTRSIQLPNMSRASSSVMAVRSQLLLS